MAAPYLTFARRPSAKSLANAVNLRKEFFRVELESIRDAVEEIGGEEVDFRTTIIAEEYFDTKRLRERSVA